MIKSKYLTKWQKYRQQEDDREERLILNSRYKPNDTVFYKGRAFLVKYALVHNDVLSYFLEGKKNVYIASEAFLASDQI